MTASSYRARIFSSWPDFNLVCTISAESMPTWYKNLRSSIPCYPAYFTIHVEQRGLLYQRLVVSHIDWQTNFDHRLLQNQFRV